MLSGYPGINHTGGLNESTVAASGSESRLSWMKNLLKSTRNKLKANASRVSPSSFNVGVLIRAASHLPSKTSAIE